MSHRLFSFLELVQEMFLFSYFIHFIRFVHSVLTLSFLHLKQCFLFNHGVFHSFFPMPVCVVFLTLLNTILLTASPGWGLYLASEFIFHEMVLCWERQ